MPIPPGHRPSRRRSTRPAAALLAGAAVLLGTTACTSGGPPPAASSADVSPAPPPAAATSTTATPAPTASPTTSPAQDAADTPASAPPVPVGAVPTTPDGDYAGVPVGTPVAYAIPDLASPAAVLPAGYALSLDLGQYRLQPVVPGQACSSRAPFNVAGRQWNWISERGWGQESVGLVVTGWRAARGAAAFDDVVQDAGTCRFVDEVAPIAVSVPMAEQVWAATTATSTGVEVTYGAARVGDLVVGVDVSGSAAESQALAADLLRAVTGELLASGLPAASSS